MGHAEEEQVQAPDAPKSRSLLQSILLITACTMTMLVNLSNSTAPSIALPTIGRELNIPENQLQWIISAYSLTSGCLLLFFGRVADLHGRRRTFIAGMLWLVAFTIGCGFCSDPITLNVLRGFQGVGAAAVTPAAIGILAHAFPPSRARSIAFATYSAGAPVGAACGIVLGGVVTQLSAQTWRSTFWLSTGLTALCLILGLLSIDPDLPSTEEDGRIDWLGAFLVTAGLVLIVFVLGQGEIAPDGWKTPYIIVLLIIGVLLVVLFFLWQHQLETAQTSESKNPIVIALRAPPPLMKVSFWSRAHGRFAAILAIAFLNWCCFLGWNFWIQLYYQEYLKLSPVLTMVRLLPMFVTGISCNVIVALVVNRIPIIALLGLGTTMTTTAALLFAVIIPEAPYWAFGFPAAICSVFGADFTFSAGSLFVAHFSQPHEQSVAGALFQTMTQLGTAVGVTVTTVVFDRVAQRQEEKAGLVPDSNLVSGEMLLPAYKAAQWTAFAFGILAISTAIIFFRGVGIIRHDQPHEPEQDSQTVGSVDQKTVAEDVKEVKTQE